ncbi:MAG: tRNA (uridine(34)/cytosine(34)/5-carboxymethylaminomethyluridine(34)-2'-O)-methyltransferase TrmL [Oscillospiraceae bacterium]|nr:tRNA (uridine(34)/cytosine(34)/5-carboxymethylaminomethyluridine(34)-2'-O)-methyltransferase TrmL [Oscillospiraceae bacterium]
MNCKINIVLFEPQIPQNTGNIARTCAVTGASLHLVKPMGFEIDDKKLKRAGLDYWHELDIKYYDSTSQFLEIHKDKKLFFFTTKGKKVYSEEQYRGEIFLIFGREDKGIDESILNEHYSSCVRVPMRENLRSLNLSNTVAIAVYEALRQNDFEALKTDGALTKY